MKKNSLHYIEERLIILKGIKEVDDLVRKQKEWKILNKVKRLTPKSADKSDFKTHLAFTVKNNKDAELLA